MSPGLAFVCPPAAGGDRLARVLVWLLTRESDHSGPLLVAPNMEHDGVSFAGVLFLKPGPTQLGMDSQQEPHSSKKALRICLVLGRLLEKSAPPSSP